MTERNVGAEELARATLAGQLEAVLGRRRELLALAPEETERLAVFLARARPADNGCCTGG